MDRDKGEQKMVHPRIAGGLERLMQVLSEHACGRWIKAATLARMLRTNERTLRGWISTLRRILPSQGLTVASNTDGRGYMLTDDVDLILEAAAQQEAHAKAELNNVRNMRRAVKKGQRRLGL